MKKGQGLWFSVINSVLSIIILMLMAAWDDDLRGELASYLLWFFIFTGFVGALAFPFLFSSYEKYNLKVVLRFVLNILSLILIINFISFFGLNGHLISFDLFREDTIGQINKYARVVHTDLMISLTITTLIFEIISKLRVFGFNQRQ